MITPIDIENKKFSKKAFGYEVASVDEFISQIALDYEALYRENASLKEKNETLLLELAKQEELKNKQLMTSMWTILITNAIFYFGILLLSVNLLEEGILLGTIICVSTIIFVIAGFIALKFEVAAGYYECKKCHHKFIPTYKEVMFAAHMSTTRYLKCPKCHKRSWAKKVLSK